MTLSQTIDTAMSYGGAVISAPVGLKNVVELAEDVGVCGNQNVLSKFIASNSFPNACLL